MGLALILICGVLNFALHRAVLERGLLLSDEARRVLKRIANGWGTYILEFAFLLGALTFVRIGSQIAAPVYAIYTLMNGIAAWLMLRRPR